MKKEQSQRRMSDSTYSAKELTNIRQEYEIMAESPLSSLSHLSLQISTTKKKKVKWKKSSEKKLLRKSYIHHHIYEVLKFYFIGQDSD